MSNELIAVPANSAEALDSAYGLIQKGHWIQGKMTDMKGGFCLMGALKAAFVGVDKDGFINIRPHREDVKELHLLNAYLKAIEALQVVIEANSLTAWNDVPHRSKESVLGALKQAKAYILETTE